MTPTPHAIEAVSLVKSYRRGARARFARSVAVDGLDLSVPAGSVHGLIGPNGAGKTSTIHMVLGLARPDSGSVSVFGEPVSDAKARVGIGYVPEKFELPPFMTARGFLELHVRLHGGIDRHDRDREVERVLDRLSLAGRADDAVGEFSKGMQQRLAIAQALLGDPRLVILDEPTSALDPIGRRDVRDLVLELRDRGATVLLNSHLLSEVEQVCDDVAIIERGRIVEHRAGDADAEPTRRLRVSIGGLTPELELRLRGIVSNLEVAGRRADGVADLHGHVDTERVAEVAATVIEYGAQLLQLRTDDDTLEDVFLRVVGSAVEVGA